MQFVGVDGEGMTVEGKHRYVLFGVGEDQIEDASGLQWQDVFSFLYQHYRPGIAFVGFFLGYDFTQIFATLPQDRAYMLLTSEGRSLRKHKIPGKAPHPVECDGWQFDILGNKRLRIRPKGCACPTPTCKCRHDPWMYVCDAGSFFQTSLLKVIDPKGWAPGTEVVTPEEYAIIEKGKENRGTAVLDDDMRFYNRLENDVLARVMRTVDAGFLAFGVHLPPSKWFGPGQAAQAWLKNEGVPTRVDLAADVPEWFYEAARMTYFGGWFELFIHGIIPGESHEYDINSAYPSIIARLPCLRHGRYSRGEGLPPMGSDTDGSLTMVYGKVESPKDTRFQHIGAMLHRDPSGRICRPLGTEGWFWWDELKAAERAGMVKKLNNRGRQQIMRWVKYDPCDCAPPMGAIAALYDRRLAVGKTSPLGKSAKLVYNSGYGKFAQSIGDPIFGNPVYASRITSGCRKQIINAIATHPKGLADVAMVATDAIYFLTPHPGLNVSDALGEWDYKARTDLTLFKPGVYWDNGTRREINEGISPHFKARGFKASDFARSIIGVDTLFREWDSSPKSPVGWRWPRVTFPPSFVMTTALQALRRNRWEDAGKVDPDPPEMVQSSSPHGKRHPWNMWREETERGWIYRTNPLPDLGASTPYEKRFGMEDPWSEEYQSQYGETEDGPITDILAWILHGR